MACEDKKGATDWTIGRLIVIVLAGVVLVLLAFGIKNGMVPNIEEIGGYMDRVGASLNFWNTTEFYECIPYVVTDFSGGSEFLKKLGKEKELVELHSCRDSSCKFEGGDLDDYELMLGEFRKLTDRAWVKYENLFSGDVDFTKDGWEMYHGGTDFLKKEGVVDMFGDVSTKQFFLKGDGSGGDEKVEMVWQDGVWTFSEEGEVDRKFTDDSEALEFFSDKVWDPLNDDEVTWRLIAGTAGVSGVDFIAGDGEYLRFLLFWNDIGGDKRFQYLYDALSAAEHRGNYDIYNIKFNDGYDPWIRTKVVGSSSSAYGPVQLTRDLAEGYLHQSKMKWSDEEKEYLERFVLQGDNFLRYGGKDMPFNGKDSNGNDVRIYDYGGSGVLTSEADKKMYRQVTEKMIEETFTRYHGRVDDVWRDWRFGANNIDDEDFGYERAFNEAWKTKELVVGRQYSDLDEIDSDADIVRLKEVFADLKEKLVRRSGLDDKEFEELKSKVSGDKVEISGKIYTVGVERFGREIVVVFSGDEKFGLMSSSNLEVMSSFEFWNQDRLEKMRLDDFPVVLVRWNGIAWDERGEQGEYKLYEKWFDETYEANVVEGFLRSACR